MTTAAQLMSELLGWLGQFITFILSFVPRVGIVPFNKRGVRYVRGREPAPVEPGLFWYWPWCTTVVQHFVCRDVLNLPAITVETKDGVTVAVGGVLVYHITDVVAFDCDNIDAEVNLVQAAVGILRDAVSELQWDQLRKDASDGSRLGAMLHRRMDEPLRRFGITVESCRFDDLARVGSVIRHFGAAPLLGVASESS